MSLDVSASAIDARLHMVSELSHPLTLATRLDCKIDLSGRGVSARIKEASDLLELCRMLERSGRAAAPTRDAGR